MAGEAPDGYWRSTAEAVIIAAHEAGEQAANVAALDHAIAREQASDRELARR